MNIKSAQKKKFRGFTLKRELINLKHGFTLIELLITIAIMGILAAAVLVAINPAKRQAQAKDANVKSDITNIVTGLQTYFTSKGAYPAQATVMTDLTTNGDLTSAVTPPAGGAASYSFDTVPDPCTSGTTCTGISVSYVLFDSTTGELWCFKSSTGKASLVTAAVGCAAP